MAPGQVVDAVAAPYRGEPTARIAPPVTAVPVATPVEGGVEVAARRPAGPPPRRSEMNELVLKALKKMPQGGGYSVRNTLPKLAASIQLNAKKTGLQLSPEVAKPSFCSGATYLVLLSVVEDLASHKKLKLSPAALEALLVKGQADGVGAWGRWNANGPGTAKFFADLGLGTNFADIQHAEPGDFMKIWWNAEIGSKERGHSVVYLGMGRDAAGNPTVRFWSSNLEIGYGEKDVPITKVVRTLFSRLENAANLEYVTQMPAKDVYLADMLKRPSTEQEMFQLCRVQSPAGSSLLSPPAEASAVPGSPASATAPPMVAGAVPPGAEAPPPPAPDLATMLAGGPYAGLNFYSKVQLLRTVQGKLKEEKLYPDAPDGSSGRKTDAAIRAWQEKKGLAVTGLLDEQTLNTLGISEFKELPEPPAPAAKGAVRKAAAVGAAATSAETTR